MAYYRIGLTLKLKFNITHGKKLDIKHTTKSKQREN
jgi:hypothetical protein